MSTVRQQLVEQYMTFLNTSRPSDVAAFERAVDSVDTEPNALPKNVLTKLTDTPFSKKTPQGEEREPGRAPILTRELTLGIVCWTAATTSAPGDDTVEPTLLWVEKCGRQLMDTTLADRVVCEYAWGLQSGVKPYCKTPVLVHIEYQHRSDDPEQVD